MSSLDEILNKRNINKYFSFCENKKRSSKYFSSSCCVIPTAVFYESFVLKYAIKYEYRRVKKPTKSKKTTKISR